MSENMSAGNEPEKAPSESGTPPPGGEGVTLTKSQAITLCATGILICFFLPWAQIFGGNVSGFDLQKLNDQQKLLWLIPIFCVITIIGGLTGRSQKIAAQLTGALPFFALAYWLHQLGGDLMKVLNIGAYGSLILGLIMFLVARRLK